MNMLDALRYPLVSHSYCSSTSFNHSCVRDGQNHVYILPPSTSTFRTNVCRRPGLVEFVRLLVARIVVTTAAAHFVFFPSILAPFYTPFGDFCLTYQPGAHRSSHLFFLLMYNALGNTCMSFGKSVPAIPMARNNVTHSSIDPPAQVF